ncbi:MAG: hypothetical protein ACR2JE_14725 [Acidobacteriaceae bacterium]
MGAVEDIRQFLQDFIAPELREMRGELKALDHRVDLNAKMLNEKIDQIALRMDQNHREITTNILSLQNYSLLSQRVANLEKDPAKH